MSEEQVESTENSTERNALSQLLDCRISRRRFLFMAAASVTTVTLANVLPGTLFEAEVAAYDGVKVGSLKDLQLGQPQVFNYPWDDLSCVNYLVKLGEPAGGGVGPDQDIVAFNTICPHMGISLLGQFKSEHQVLGPCPSHLSTYDLTRHGMVARATRPRACPKSCWRRGEMTSTQSA